MQYFSLNNSVMASFYTTSICGDSYCEFRLTVVLYFFFSPADGNGGGPPGRRSVPGCCCCCCCCEMVLIGGVGTPMSSLIIVYSKLYFLSNQLEVRKCKNTLKLDVAAAAAAAAAATASVAVSHFHWSSLLWLLASKTAAAVAQIGKCEAVLEEAHLKLKRF